MAKNKAINTSLAPAAAPAVNSSGVLSTIGGWFSGGKATDGDWWSGGKATESDNKNVYDGSDSMPINYGQGLGVLAPDDTDYISQNKEFYGFDLTEGITD